MVRLSGAYDRLALARHECAHAACASACGMRVQCVRLRPEPYTHVRYRIDRAQLPQCWRVSSTETARRVIEAIGVILAPSILDPDGSPWRAGSDDAQLLRCWQLAWNRLRIGSGRTTIAPWDSLERQARVAVDRWGTSADAWLALTWLAEALMQAGALSGRQWTALWQQKPVRALWSPEQATVSQTTPLQKRGARSRE